MSDALKGWDDQRDRAITSSRSPWCEISRWVDLFKSKAVGAVKIKGNSKGDRVIVFNCPELFWVEISTASSSQAVIC